MATELNYKNHRMLVPGYHFVLAAILVVNLLFRGGKLFSEPNLEGGMALLLAIGFVMIFWYVRIFALRAHDRVIRLEMRLRLAEVLPEDLRGRIDELGRRVIGLRFASDAELPDLVRAVLENGLSGEDAKRKIKNWQPDTWRF
jgi:hypothetical protein